MANIYLLQYDDLLNLPLEKKQRLRSIIYRNFEHLCSWKRLNHSNNEIDRLLTSPNTTLFLYILNNSIIGYVLTETININDKNVLFINYIYVIAKYRRNGIGNDLMNSVINHAASKKLKRIVLVTDINTNAYKWYRRLGFKHDKDINNPSEQHVAMYLRLE